MPTLPNFLNIICVFILGFKILFSINICIIFQCKICIYPKVHFFSFLSEIQSKFRHCLMKLKLFLLRIFLKKTIIRGLINLISSKQLFVIKKKTTST